MCVEERDKERVRCVYGCAFVNGEQRWRVFVCSCMEVACMGVLVYGRASVACMGVFV